jgi:hypothetical protein
MAVIKISDNKNLPPVIKITDGKTSKIHKIKESVIVF